MKTLTRIAVAGAGLIGKAHIAAIQSSTTVRLAALVDPSPLAHETARAASVPLVASLEELFALDRPDGVVLATPNALHVPQALTCLQAQVPVLVEKPIAPTVTDAQRLVQAAASSSVPVLIGHHRAHSAIMARACEVVASGKLGRLVAVQGSAVFLKPDHYFDDGPWRKEPGGGPILLNLIHEVHNLRMLLGEIVSVQAMDSRAVRGFAVEDTVSINLRFASGALGSFLLSDTAACARSWEQTSQENKAYPSSDDEDCYVVMGTHGSLSVPTMRVQSYASDADRSWWKPFEHAVLSLARNDPIQRQMEHFGAVVRGEEAPKVSARDGLANLLVTEAIVQAAQSGSTVMVSA